MAEEKVFNIPLRVAFDKQRNRRASNAIKIIREFLIRHMKTEEVKIGNSINISLWENGIQNPPRKVRIHAIKEGEVVYAELLNVEIKTTSKEDVKKKEEKKKQKETKIKEERKERKSKTIQDEIQEEVEGKIDGAAPEQVVEERTEARAEKDTKVDSFSDKHE